MIANRELINLPAWLATSLSSPSLPFPPSPSNYNTKLGFTLNFILLPKHLKTVTAISPIRVTNCLLRVQLEATQVFAHRWHVGASDIQTDNHLCRCWWRHDIHLPDSPSERIDLQLPADVRAATKQKLSAENYRNTTMGGIKLDELQSTQDLTAGEALSLAQLSSSHHA